MPFIHPAVFVTGMVAASIPIIIHLLNRRRFKIREWAAMKFLLESLKKNRRRVQIEELILLALRTLVIVLLAMAVARFTGCSDAAGGGNTLNSGTSMTVYVLDDSCSMSQRLGGGTIFSSAATDLVEDLKKLDQSHQFAIVLTSAADSPSHFQNSTFAEKQTVETVVSQLQGLQPRQTRTQLDKAMVAAKAIFEEQREVQTKNLVVLSDFRKVDLTRDASRDLRTAFGDLVGLGVKVTAMDYGRDTQSNLTVESVELMDKFALARQPLRAKVTVRNNGPSRIESVPLKVTVQFPQGDNIQELSGTVRESSDGGNKGIDPGTIRTFECQVKVPQAGAAVLKAAVADDELAEDSTGFLALDVRQALRVLVVDGTYEVTRPLFCESFMLQVALDPLGNMKYGNKVDIVSVDALGNAPLDEYDAVVLVNVPSFPMVQEPGQPTQTCPQLASLESYVKNGGGLVIIPGSQISPDFYGPSDTDPKKNLGLFYNSGRGLLPMPLATAAVETKDAREYFKLDSLSLANDAVLGELNKFKAEGVDLTSLIRFRKFVQVIEDAGTAAPDDNPLRPARVVARFSDPRHSPAVVVREYHKGNVVLFCSSAGHDMYDKDGNWNDWASEPIGSFGATMNDMVTYVARPAIADLTRKVGEKISMEIPTRFRGASYVLRGPQHPAIEDEDLAAEAATVAAEGEAPAEVSAHTMLRSDKTTWAGVYKIAMKLPDYDAAAKPESRRDVMMARNVDPSEGQLAAGHSADLTAALDAKENQLTYVDRTGTTTVVAAAVPSKDYWLWCVCAMLALMAAETFLGQKFGHYNK